MTGSGDQIALRAAKMSAAAAASGSSMDTSDDTSSAEIAAIVASAEADAAGAISQLKGIVDASKEDMSGSELKRKELAINRLATLYNKGAKIDELRALIMAIRPFMNQISKAKGGKLFRHLLDMFLSIKEHLPLQVSTVIECIEWTKETKRRFLRQTLEIMLAGLQLSNLKYQECLAIAQPLIKELKRLDDKLQLVEVQLMESQAYYALSNYPKSRAALVSARTTANGIYCPPKMQASLDIQSGIMHAQEQDFTTAYSYFYEAFEGFDSTSSEKNAVRGLKYMLLCKIMLEKAEDVPSILSSKLALKYSSGDLAKELEAMKAVATSNRDRSLKAFEKALQDFKEELAEDVIIQSHVSDMYDTMLQNNLCRIVEAYSSIEIVQVAKLINLPQDVVESQLSKMILDKKLNGILDQGVGCLEIFEDMEADSVYTGTIEAIEHTSNVVDALYKKSQKLM